MLKVIFAVVLLSLAQVWALRSGDDDTLGNTLADQDTNNLKSDVRDLLEAGNDLVDDFDFDDQLEESQQAIGGERSLLGGFHYHNYCKYDKDWYLHQLKKIQHYFHKYQHYCSHH